MNNVFSWTTMALALALFACVAEAADDARFGKTVDSETVRFSQALSPDQKTASILFDNFGLDLQPRANEPGRSISQSFSYARPIELGTDCRAVITQDWRGFVATKGSGKVGLAIFTDGRLQAVDIPAAVKAAKKQASNKPTSDDDAEGEEIYARIKTSPSEVSRAGTIAVLFAETGRGDTAALAMISVESVETVIDGSRKDCGK